MRPRIPVFSLRRAMRWIGPAIVMFPGTIAPAATVQLLPADPNHATLSSHWRWLDAANHPYSALYRAAYTYDAATVRISFSPQAPVLRIHLAAANLKPNFAYQVKIEGVPGSDSGERIGLTGRWWREEWDGAQWTNGWNLNEKGNGESPNPNDQVYFAEKDIPDPTSPTGFHYRFTPYLLFGYFITDAAGDAAMEFTADSSFHVLWKTTQRSHTAADGPVETASVVADPLLDAYDTAAPATDVGIFGEWERLPPSGVPLPPGEYDCRLLITEESFHGSGGQYAGFWATAMVGSLHFTLGTPPTITEEPESILAHAGDRVVFRVTAQGAPAPQYRWLHDGSEIADADSAELVLDPVRAADAGTYSCRIQNGLGSVSTHGAHLAVIETDADGDDLDDAWEIAYFGDLSRPANEDFDGDGYTNLQEFIRGTDPTRCRLVLHPGWNDVSIGRLPPDNHVSAVLGAAADLISGPVWVWKADHYETTDRFLPLRGHWLYCTAAQDTVVDLAVPVAEP